ncbi:unnamed protein product [Heterosigma akashiwo]
MCSGAKYERLSRRRFSDWLGEPHRFRDLGIIAHACEDWSSMVAQIIRMDPNNKEASFVELTPRKARCPSRPAPLMLGPSGSRGGTNSSSDSMAPSEAQVAVWVAAAPAQPATRTVAPTPAPGPLPTATATPESPTAAWAAAPMSPLIPPTTAVAPIMMPTAAAAPVVALTPATAPSVAPPARAAARAAVRAAAERGIMRQGKPKPPSEGGANGWFDMVIVWVTGLASSQFPAPGPAADRMRALSRRGRLPSPSFKRSCSCAWWKSLDIGA